MKHFPSSLSCLFPITPSAHSLSLRPSLCLSSRETVAPHNNQQFFFYSTFSLIIPSLITLACHSLSLRHTLYLSPSEAYIGAPVPSGAKKDHLFLRPQNNLFLVSCIVHLSSTTTSSAPRHSHAVFASPWGRNGAKFRARGTCVAGCHKWSEGRPLVVPSVAWHPGAASHPSPRPSGSSTLFLSLLYSIRRVRGAP